MLVLADRVRVVPFISAIVFTSKTPLLTRVQAHLITRRYSQL